jgi:tetratricopeptide (TPR) repeat protein
MRYEDHKPVKGLRVEREGCLRELSARYEQDGAAVINLLGESGLGKSALLAMWLERLFVASGEACSCVYVDLEGFVYVGADGEAGSWSVQRLEEQVLTRGRRSRGDEEDECHPLEGVDLLILDNADPLILNLHNAKQEHLLAKLLNRWIDNSLRENRDKKLKILISSRQLVAPSIAKPLHLAPLSPQQAIELFTLHLAHVRPDLKLSHAEHTLIPRIVAKLDANPLIIILAARRARVLSLDQLLDRLQSVDASSHPILQKNPDHPLSVAFVQTWSMLSAPAQQLAKHAALFQTYFSLEAIEAITEPATRHDAIEHLQQLLEHSLVRRSRDAHTNCFNVPMSLRTYLIELLHDDPALPALQQRYTLYLLDLAQRALSLIEREQLSDALDLLGPYLEDLLLARRYAQRLDPEAAATFSRVFQRLAHLQHGSTGVLTLIGACLDLSSSAPQDPRQHVAQLHQRAQLLLRSGQTAAALQDLDHATKLLTPHDDPALSVELHQTMAAVHIRSGQLDAARYHYERALLHARSAAERTPLLAKLGRLCMNLGEHPRAQEALQEALDLVRSLPPHASPLHDISEAKLLSYLATLRLAQGRLAEVRSLSREALLVSRQDPDPKLVASLREHLGLVSHELGDLIDAARQYELAILASHQASARPQSSFTSSLRLGQLALDHLQAPRALTHFQDVLNDPSAHRVPFALALAHLGHALAHLIEDQPQLALEHLRASSSQLHQLRLPHLEALSLGFQAIAQALCGHPAAALEDLALAQLRLAHPPPPWHLDTLSLIELLVTLSTHNPPDPSHIQALQTLADQLQERVELASDRFDPSPHGLTEARLRFTIELAQRAAWRANQAQASNTTAQRTEIPPTDALTIGPECSWFKLPGSAHIVELRRKRVLRRLLEALVSSRLDQPGDTISSDELIQAGWPDELHMLNESAHNRLYVALNRLRAEGLEALLQTERDGYRLDPLIPLHLHESP